MSNSLERDHIAGPDLGPNCLKRVSADISRHRVKDLKYPYTYVSINKVLLASVYSNHRLKMLKL